MSHRTAKALCVLFVIYSAVVLTVSNSSAKLYERESQRNQRPMPAPADAAVTKACADLQDAITAAQRANFDLPYYEITTGGSFGQRCSQGTVIWQAIRIGKAEDEVSDSTNRTVVLRVADLDLAQIRSVEGEVEFVSKKDSITVTGYPPLRKYWIGLRKKEHGNAFVSALRELAKALADQSQQAAGGAIAGANAGPIGLTPAQRGYTVERLLRQGPQFPTILDPTNFSAFFIVEGDWPVVVRYELEAGATATISIEPPSPDVERMSMTLPPTDLGNVIQKVMKVPRDFGDTAQVVEIRFRAFFTDSKGNSKSPTFILRSLGCGSGAFAEGSSPQRDHHPRLFTTGATSADDEVAIKGITLDPKDIFTPSKGQLSISFTSAKDFDRWGIRILKMNDVAGGPDKVPVITIPTYKRISKGQKVFGSWDGKGADKKPVTGNCEVWVFAWNIDKEKDALVTFSDPPLLKVQ
jgi:hypothetical protein